MTINQRELIIKQAEEHRIRTRVVFVNAAVEQERKFQDNKWGNIDTSGHSIAEWIMIAEAELAEAKQAVIKGGTGRNSVRSEIIQTMAVLRACLEQHGTEDTHGGRAI